MSSGFHQAKAVITGVDRLRRGDVGLTDDLRHHEEKTERAGQDELFPCRSVHAGLPRYVAVRICRSKARRRYLTIRGKNSVCYNLIYKRIQI